MDIKNDVKVGTYMVIAEKRSDVTKNEDQFKSNNFVYMSEGTLLCYRPAYLKVSI